MSRFMSAPFIFSNSLSFVYWAKIYLIEYTVLLSILWHVNTWVIYISFFAIFMLPFSCLNLLKHQFTQSERTCACCSPYGPSLEMSGNTHSFHWFESALLSSNVSQELTPWSVLHKGWIISLAARWWKLPKEMGIILLVVLWVILSRFSKNNSISLMNRGLKIQLPVAFSFFYSYEHLYCVQHTCPCMFMW